MVRATWTPSSPTLAKMNDGVSLLTNFSELKFDDRFGCPFDIKTCTPTVAMVEAIWIPSSPPLVKKNDGVSLLTNFSKLKFDNRFDARLIDNCALQLS